MSTNVNSHEPDDYWDPEAIFEQAFGAPGDLPKANPFQELIDILSRESNVAVGEAKIKRFLAAREIEPEDFGAAHNWERWLRDNVDEGYDWLIPDLIERMERVILVAPEGAGKTFMMRQVAICVAAGIHPFTGARITPLRTLSIDLENPDRIIRRTSRRIMDLARYRSHLRQDDPIEAHILSRPGGVNLFSGAHKRGIEALIEEVRPDILFFGPLYKSFIELPGRSEASMATELAMYFDYLRTEYGCALWLEQHAPLGNGANGRELRPFGSSVWSRWPEFGINLSADPTSPGDYNMGFFRGARDERKWPETLRRGKKGVDFPFVVTSFRVVDDS